MVRRLVLLRHAKSAWPSGVPDHDRPLAGKGRRNAQATGGWFATEGPRPDLVLCSDALRARQTWEIAAAVLDPAPACRLEPTLYGAAPDELIELARDQNVKDELIANTQEAIERGVFGLPSFIVGGELWFGKDRLRDVEEALLGG